MSGACLKVYKLSERCWEDVWFTYRRCIEGVCKVIERFPEGFWGGGLGGILEGSDRVLRGV